MIHGAIDLHVHAGPDVRPRKMSAVELVRAAQAAGMRGLLLKNHHAPTVLQASALAECYAGFAVFGGIVLNEAVGGYNTGAVLASLQMGASAVWMPTLNPVRGLPGAEILRLIAERNAILATGHFPPKQLLELVRDARAAGVAKILVNHPEIEAVNLPLALQKEISGPDIFFERCYCRAGFVLDWDGLANVIRETGVERNVIATDLGQPQNPDPVTGLRQMHDELAQRGFSAVEIETMMCGNPALLLGLK
jgi:hypothetical protein